MTPHADLPTLPRSLADITPEWLTEALRQGEASGTAAVHGLSASTIGDEHGFTGVVARLEPKYGAGEPGPACIVAKLPLAERAVESSYRRRAAASATARRQMAERADREVRFLTEFGSHQPALAPRLLYGRVDVPANAAVLLLEDMWGARQADLLAGMSAVEVRAVLRAMADFHARWWGRAPSTAGWLPAWNAHAPGRQARYDKAVGPFLERYAGQLAPGVVDVVARLRTRYEAVIAALRAAPQTIAHTDLHADNVLLRGAAQDPSAVVLDWQTVALGPAALDVGTLVVGSMTTSDRRQHERQLLAEYWQRITAAGVTGYGLDDLWRDYRAATLWQLAGVVGWLSTAEPEALSGRERLIVERLVDDPRVFEAALESASALSGT